MSYTILDAAMLLLIATAYRIVRPAVSLKRFLLLLGSLLLLTVIFDNVIIGLHIVAYHRQHILGIYLGKMPIEDLSYALGACLLVPLFWGRQTDVT